jgi:hypothetical protein
MALRAVRIGPDPDQADGLFRNRVETDRRMLTALTYGREGHLAGGDVAPASGTLAVTVAPHDSLVLAEGGTGERGTYFATDSETLTVPAIAPEAQSRIDALVLMVRDSQYGNPPAGKQVGPVLEFVKGVAGTAPTPPTDSDITAQFGTTTGGGWFRAANVRIDPTDTVINAANIDITGTRIPVNSTGLISAASGQVLLSDGGSAPSSVAVTFPPGRFTAPPQVGLTHGTGALSSTISNLWVAPSPGVTVDGFTAVIARNTTTSVSVMWTAIQTEA